MNPLLLSNRLTNNSIEAWFRNTDNGSGLPFNGTVTLSLFGTKKDLANGDVPDLNKKFYSSVFNVTPGNGANWYGLFNLNWGVQDPGKYFAAFEILPGNTYAGFMPFPNPLIFNGNSTAGRPANSVEWGSAGPLSIGLRVDASPIPEPATMLLLGSGLISAFVRRKFI